jgi:CDP-glucose 4,6-dehydratase
MVNKAQFIKTYKGKKIFLTGHTGFKGSWLLKIFAIIGAEVKGYALEPENELNLFNIIKGEQLCESVIGDIRDKKHLEEAITSFQPDFIFHLAAQPLVRRSYEIPAETFEVNVIGTANVLDAMAKLNKPCSTVLITTDKVYHNNEWAYPYRENDRLGGYDPYSASKACAELLIESYRNSFFNINKYASHKKALAVGRAGNVIGGGDWAKDRLIPDIIRALSKNETIEVRNPDAVRPWQHVLEPLFGYLLLGVYLAENPEKFSQAYNFGPKMDSGTFSVKEMVELAINCWGNGIYKSNKDFNNPHEAGLLKLDISKAFDELKWQPLLNAELAVSFTVNWYKNFYQHPQGIIEYTEEQIALFMDKFYDK